MLYSSAELLALDYINGRVAVREYGGRLCIGRREYVTFEYL